MGNSHPGSGDPRHIPVSLDNGNGPSFHSGTFITAQTVNHSRPTGMDLLHRTVVLEALHDSADSLPPPPVNDGITTWLDHWWLLPGEVHYLPRRPSGTSAFMRTLCQSLEDTNRLGGGFFFEKDHPTRGNAKQLFSTLAYQLALKNRHLKPVISQCVEDDPSVVGRHMGVQLRKLIVDPLKSLRDSGPQIFVIDGLDECDTPDTQVEILRLIGSVARQYPDTFRFIIASRPEAHISEAFKDPSFDGILSSIDLDQYDSDIGRETDVCDDFAGIHRESRGTTPPGPIGGNGL
jgi:hypothetical protein